MTITEFLEARITEDEACARSAEESLAGAGAYWQSAAKEVFGANGTRVADTQSGWYADHIARHDPARVLAECAAKRAIVGLHRRTVDAYNDAAGDTCTMCADSGPEAQSYPCATLQALAAVYAPHPDYRQEWAV